MVNPQRVLVVDDDPGMREGMAMSLKRAGFVTEQARSGEDAMRLTRPGAFDAVVTDLRMTGMDGLQLTARLKALDTSLPVLLVTAFGSLDTAREAMRLGAFDYLSKPFGPDELVQAVRKAIRSDGRLKAEEPGRSAGDPHPGPGPGGNPGPGPARRRQPGHHPDPGGERHRQGTAGQAHPRRQPPAQGRLRGHQLRRHPREPPGIRTVRLREGRLHRGHQRQARRFEQADGGTLVLDEIGELPLASRASCCGPSRSAP